jgi:hypothetical protein
MFSIVDLNNEEHAEQEFGEDMEQNEEGETEESMNIYPLRASLSITKVGVAVGVVKVILS